MSNAEETHTMPKVVAGYVRALYPALQTGRAVEMYDAPIGPELTITLPCADCGASLTYDVGNEPGEPCCPACVSTRTEETGAPTWVAIVGPIGFIALAFVMALLHVRSGGCCYAAAAMAWPVGKMTPTLNWKRLAYVQDHAGIDFRVGIEEGSRAQTSAVRSQWLDRAWARDARPEDEAIFSTPLPDLDAIEEVHGFTGDVLMVEYAGAHAPTHEEGLRVCDQYAAIVEYEEIGL